MIELARFLPFSQIHQTFLDQLTETIGVVLNMIIANMRTEELLEQSQKLTQELQSQSKELQPQQEELKRSNAELEAQAKTLKAVRGAAQGAAGGAAAGQRGARGEGRAARGAEPQGRAEEPRGRGWRGASLEEKAEQLALSSKYKSEFLANMSHELRTPLNSLLILAKLLADNKDGNLTAKQVEFAQTIHSSGTDLLNLINDILDLSKVEAGKMEVQPARTCAIERDRATTSSARSGRWPSRRGSRFESRARRRHCRPPIDTDGQRLQQVLKNLLSNAFKFTEKGGGDAHDRARRRDEQRVREPRSSTSATTVIAFAVTRHRHRHPEGQAAADLRGVPAGRRHDQPQVRRHGPRPVDQPRDRAAARRRDPRGEHAGRGQHVHALPAGAELSAPRRGVRPRRRRRPRSRCATRPQRRASGRLARSTQRRRAATGAWRRRRSDRPPRGGRRAVARARAGPRARPTTATTLHRPGDRVLLVIVEDDANFAGSLLEMAREQGFKGLRRAARRGGLKLAHAFKPDAITLDIDMPGMDGWAVLDRLKHHPETRHIPVHIITGRRTAAGAQPAGAVALPREAGHARRRSTRRSRRSPSSSSGA